ncbi:hypothetical protein BU16DRAFT_522158 [Lophium mytilinum]|uniref:Transglycosylase SLT domain-containing protein n=1 Tax=Lophium mytilinum TaxID=390894 RepID=A0A6A6R936_9PEZI|nr:hypothetical protein BU16DRAFT_522158 [Lophium mytilinum]
MHIKMLAKIIPLIAALGLLPTVLAYPAQVSPGLATVSNGAALKWYSTNFDKGGPAPEKAASFYNCHGTELSDFPSFEEWISFDDMWKINEPILEAVNPEYLDLIPTIREKIELVSADSQVDARLILAVIMEESTGNLNVPCTQGSMTNCGLMQAAGGSVSFNPKDPENSIEQMIRDGVQGVGAAPGLAGYLNGVSWINNGQFGNPYLAAHIYNAGCASGGDNLAVVEGSGPKSKVYASDISSRLTGWNGERAGCLASAQCPGQLRQASDC